MKNTSHSIPVGCIDSGFIIGMTSEEDRDRERERDELSRFRIQDLTELHQLTNELLYEIKRMSPARFARLRGAICFCHLHCMLELLLSNKTHAELHEDLVITQDALLVFEQTLVDNRDFSIAQESLLQCVPKIRFPAVVFRLLLAFEEDNESM